METQVENFQDQSGTNKTLLMESKVQVCGQRSHCWAAPGTSESLRPLTLSLALTWSLAWNVRWFCHKQNWVTAQICLATCSRCDDKREEKSRCDTRGVVIVTFPRHALGQFPFFFFFSLYCVLSDKCDMAWRVDRFASVVWNKCFKQ